MKSMNRQRIIKIAFVVAGVIATLLVLSSPGMAQCAMCKNAVTGSPEATRLSQNLNFAIIVLLIPPVLIFCGFFFVLFRQMRKSKESAPHAESDGRGVRHSWLWKLGLRRKNNERKRREAGGAIA
jgi:uncharacterized BrkB/YihY/UPF0761 family membrane protein